MPGTGARAKPNDNLKLADCSIALNPGAGPLGEQHHCAITSYSPSLPYSYMACTVAEPTRPVRPPRIATLASSSSDTVDKL